MDYKQKYIDYKLKYVLVKKLFDLNEQSGGELIKSLNQAKSLNQVNEDKYAVYKDKLVKILQTHHDDIKPYYTVMMDERELQVNDLDFLN